MNIGLELVTLILFPTDLVIRCIITHRTIKCIKEKLQRKIGDKKVNVYCKLD